MLDFKKYREITIDGVNYCGQDLQTYIEIEDGLAGWQKNMNSLIKDWISDEEYITAYSSGSTGQAKELSFHKNQLVASALATEAFFKLKKNQKALLCLPAEYIAGKMMIIRALVSGLNLIPVKPNSNPCGSYSGKIHFAAMLPFQFQTAFRENYNELNKIETLILGGSKLNPEGQNQAMKLDSNIYETYGMTETLTHVALRNVKTDTSFQAINQVTFETDSDSCLIIHAPHITEDKIHTNDVVELISSQRFNLLGRKDNVINSGGLKLIPEYMESKLSALIKRPYFITSKMDDKYGERPILIVEEGGEKLNATALHSYFSKHEKIEEIIEVEKIYFTSSGKVDRSRTKKKYNLF